MPPVPDIIGATICIIQSTKLCLVARSGTPRCQHQGKLMDTQQILGKFIKEELAFGQGAVDFTVDDALIEQGIIDSLGILKLSTFVEKEFGIRIDDEDLVPENFENIAALAHFIDSKK
jgi:acyl carrier protein